MPRALFFFATIVAAFPLHLAAATPTFEDVPMPTPVAELALRLGLDPVRDRAMFMPEMVRLLYADGEAKPLVFPGLLSARSTATTVPVPLGAAVWGRAVFRRVVPPSQLVVMILSDREAALLCRGLAGLDDETLWYLAEHPALIAMLYEHAAPIFAAFGDTFRVREGRVVPPGGAQAVPLWEAAARASVATPDRFARAVFAEHEGRLGYLYHVVASADVASASFALGLWIPDPAARVERFIALLEACEHGYAEWQPLRHPFLRPLADLAVLLLRMRVEPSGAPSEPAGREFWARALDVSPNIPTTTVNRELTLIDAAWIVGASAGLDMYARNDRLDQFAFGQRVFAGIDETAATTAADVIRDFRRYRMLSLTLERMGIRSPAIHRAVLRGADAIASAPAERRFWALAQFQGALALLARMQRSRTLTAPETEALVTSFLAVTVDAGEYRGNLAHWIRASLGRALGPGGTWEQRTIVALAGLSEDKRAPRIFWEGQTYRVDLPLAERQRLEIVRRKQGGHTLDLALAIESIGRTLGEPRLSVDGVRAASDALKSLIDQSGPELKHPTVNLLPPGVAVPLDAVDVIGRAIQDLAKVSRPGDVRSAARIGTSLRDLSDIVLGHALVSWAYAADMGDPNSAALLAGNVALRHDFGLARRDSDSRRIAWAPPRQDFRPGVPWHIVGSILGLDIALAPLNLRRLDLDRPIDAPKLSSIERDGLAVGVTLMDPLRMTDSDRDAIAEAIGRGRARVEALYAGREPLDTIVAVIGLDGWRRRELTWAMEDSLAAVAQQFSLVDLLALGGGATTADVDAWGTPAIYSEGCPCSKLPQARAWRALEGRPQVPMMAATMGDLNLAVALMLRDLNLPAVLARPVLSVGMPDFIDDLGAASRPDWRYLSRQAQSLRRQRVEDYVSAAAAVNGPLVPEEPDASHEPVADDHDPRLGEPRPRVGDREPGGSKRVF